MATFTRRNSQELKSEVMEAWMHFVCLRDIAASYERSIAILAPQVNDSFAPYC